MPGPETLAAPAPDEGVPQSDTKPAAEQQAADSVPVEQAKAVVAAKQAEVIAQETGKVELGSMPGKSFVTSAELQQIDKTTNPADKAADDLAQAVAASKAALPDLAKEHATNQETAKQPETVRVQRTSGAIEDDWKIEAVRMNGRAIVTKPERYKSGGLTGRIIHKAIPIRELNQLNPGLNLVDPSKPPTPDFLKNVPVPNTEPEPLSRPATPDFLKNVPVPNTEPEALTKPATPDFLKNVAVPNTEDESVLKAVPVRNSPLIKAGATEPTIKPVTFPTLPTEQSAPEQDATTRYFEKVSGTQTTEQATTTPETTEGSAQERFTALQQELIATMAQKGVKAELYRQGNRVSAEYTDKDGKSIGLESIRAIFGAEQTLKIADLAGKLEVALYANPELSQELAARETTSEKVSRLASASIDRLGAAMRSRADQLKPKGLWAQAKGWLNRGKDRIASIATSFQAKVGEIRRQRSERRVATNFQRFSKTFNLMTPDMVRTDQAVVKLGREVEAGIQSQEYTDAAEVVAELAKKIDRLKVMDARLGRMKEIRSLEKRRDNFQKQINMLSGQLAKLNASYSTVDQELKQQQTLERESLAEELAAQKPTNPAYVGPEIDKPSSTNAPDDRTSRPDTAKPPLVGREPYYSQEQEIDETLGKNTGATPIPMGPPAAAPDTAGPEANPEATGGEAA